jgi:hypothetical protein
MGNQMKTLFIAAWTIIIFAIIISSIFVIYSTLRLYDKCNNLQNCTIMIKNCEDSHFCEANILINETLKCLYQCNLLNTSGFIDMCPQNNSVCNFSLTEMNHFCWSVLCYNKMNGILQIVFSCVLSFLGAGWISFLTVYMVIWCRERRSSTVNDETTRLFTRW